MMIKLTDNDRRVLQFAMLRADWPISRIASALSLKEHVVRHSLQRLKMNGLISQRCAIDQSFYGLTPYNIVFSLRETTREAHQALSSFLSQRTGVGWAVELGGSYQYEVTLVTESPQGVALFFHDLNATTGVSIAQKALVVEYHQIFFGIRYLGMEIGEPASVSLCVADAGRRLKLDKVDEELVWVIANSDEFSVSHFARQLGLPAATVAYKIQRLRELGVISAPLFSVKYFQLGLERTHLLISSSRTDKSFIEHLTEFCEKTAGVYALISCIGSWDFKVVIVAENQRQTKSVIDAISDRFGANFYSTSAVPCLEQIHVSWHFQGQKPRRLAASESAKPVKLLRRPIHLL